MYKLLIFDWDGTVIDSTSRIISSMQAAAQDCSFPVPSNSAVMNIIGLGLPEAINILIPNVDTKGIEQMRVQYGHHFLGINETPTPLFPGVQTTLENLYARGIRMAVATGKSRRGLDRAFAQTGLAALFETSRCADETVSKPNPLMLEEILTETGISASEAVMIGDTEYDLEMGKRAGMDVIAVSYGAHHIDRLKGFDPVLEIDRFPELEHWLESKGAFTLQ